MTPFKFGHVQSSARTLDAVYLVVFGGFACLFPLAFYCLMLAGVNGRRRPAVVPGAVDFAGVLVATSGFLFVGGPLVLAGLYHAWRQQALHGSLAAIRGALTESSGAWRAAWAGYFVLVVGGAVWLLVRRRRFTVVYNLDPTDAQKLIPDLLNHLTLQWTDRRGSYYIGFAPATASERPAALGPGRMPVVPTERAVLGVTIVPGMRHATLRWSLATGGVRRRVEAELRRALAGVESSPNPVAGWLLAAATAMFAVLLVLLGLFVAMLWRAGA